MTPSPGSTASTREPTVADGNAGYTVIARRYRPQRFEDVVGQDHVVQSLRNAIRMNRVTHAYVFSGTRGVGKTSIARIFAKCLNCVHGPTETPCLECDICQAIAVGQDVDVIEIDGASNNGVEAVRELRQNAGLRPSRARYKIYYIDEVHMLSTGAFNALLKTLEEPPEHVKFFFATTEPNKIPITVLSRCQRYDFAGISPEQVVETLAEICRREQVDAEPEALRAVARRAGGSMRDAQSLLEQLLSGGGDTLTLELVHRRLGTASDERLLDLIESLAARDAAASLVQLDTAANEGVQPVDLLNGLLEYLRDLMSLAAGAGDVLLTATPRQKPRLEQIVATWSLDAIVAALQILAETRGRMRGSPHARLLVELALVRVARLENYSDLGEMIARLGALEAGTPLPAPAASEKKKGPEPSAQPPAASPPSRPAAARSEPTNPVVSPASNPTSAPDSPPVELQAVRSVWKTLVQKVGVRLGVPLSQAERFLAISGPNTLVIRLPAGYDGMILDCDTAEARARIEQILARLLHQAVVLRFERTAASSEGTESVESPASTAANRRSEVEGDPMVRRVVELFEARPLHMEYDQDPPGA
ncbi:MAG: DNA polymerase III subunit gamma/tau [Isosphaeraceae bacterium]